ncbi:unnamed protein product [Didymodactylos carnosus]|uniref:Uncharacterized protein n=1 Tax=Didymodactylos carnosus TaxID=1234261 RepID=A0A8S2EXD3_9BILA|nr:unnamed protein product [Didymodactylos carnosus]CAF4070929.1 unnamed protein product [Didymodactylos carnosus]
MTCVHDATIKQYTTEQNQEKKEKQRVTRYLVEVETIRNIRKRTFSHWPHKIPSKSQIIEAGFFYCNVGDRVICIYCNIICQQWTSHSDDPIEIHKILSPNCPYVRSMLKRSISANNIRILNEIDQKSSQTTAIINSSNTTPMKTNNNNMINSKEIVLTAASNQQFTELPKRTASFITWPTESLPSVDDLVKSGFFYTGNKTIVTCFYCNGSLQNWGPNDNPMIEHSRWFPHCAYARQLCGDDLYRKIQETKRIAQERLRANEQRSERFSVSNTHENSNNTDNSSPMNSEIVLNNKELQLPDENTLSRLVAARLDLPISQNLLKKFKLSIIKRCYEDQLRLKHNDFVSDCDLLMACNILQKQIEHIDGKKENIIIPSVHMKTLREQAEKERIGKI